MPKRWRRLRKIPGQIFESILALLLAAFANLFPFSSLHGVSRVIVWLGWPFLGAARKRIKTNIARVFPDMTSKELNIFSRNNLVHSVRITLEFTQSWKLRNPKTFHRFLKAGNETTHYQMENGVPGVIYVVGHFGNWEMALNYGSYYLDLGVSVKKQSNRFIDKLVYKLRSDAGASLYYLDESDKLLRHVKRGGCLALAADQNARGHGIFVNFLGAPASTFQGPAILAYATKAPLFIAHTVFRGKGVYKVYMMQLVDEVRKDDYNSRQEAIRDLTQRWVGALEQAVLQEPEQYFWLHRRWRTQPREDQEVLEAKYPRDLISLQ